MSDNSTLTSVVTMKMRILAVGLVAAGTAAAGQAEKARQQDFATKAAVANLFEMEAAKVEIDKGNARDAKAFANDMMADHGKAGPVLTEAAKTEGVTVPSTLDDEHQKKIDALKQSDAANIDQAYLSTQLTAHEDAVALFMDYSKKGPDGDLKIAANSLVPTLRAHLVRVRGLTSK